LLKLPPLLAEGADWTGVEAAPTGASPVDQFAGTVQSSGPLLAVEVVPADDEALLMVPEPLLVEMVATKGLPASLAISENLLTPSLMAVSSPAYSG